MRTATPAGTAQTRRPGTTLVPGLAPRVACGVAAAVLLAASLWLPLWQSKLLAPQYPDGLALVAYGGRIEGDLAEIDTLNHYVGMKPFEEADVPELSLWLPTVILAVAGVAVVTASTGRGRWRWPRRLVIAGMWAIPVGVLADIQFRLYQFGHDLDPMAALRIPKFTPLVVGPTKVWNFTAWSFPSWGLGAVALAAALVTFGPRLWSRSIRRRGAGAAALVAAMLVAAAPSAAWADDAPHAGHDDPAPAVSMGDGQPGHDGHASAPVSDRMRPVAEIEALVDAAPDGGTVRVPAGTYHGNLVLDRSVALVGEGMPVIHGDGTTNVLTVTAEGASVEGIAVMGSGPGPTGNPAGIRIEADGVSVVDVLVEDTYSGIAVVGVDRARIERTTIRGRAEASVSEDGHAVGAGGAGAHHRLGRSASFTRGDGVSAWNAQGLLVRDVLVEDVRDGIYLQFCTDVLVDTSAVRGSRYGIHAMYARSLVMAESRLERNLSGAVLMYGGPALLLRNQVSESRSPSTGFGVLLKDVEGAELVQNLLVSNRVGLHLDGPAGTTIPTRVHRNAIALNEAGVALYPSATAAFSANDFLSNTTQVVGRGTNPSANTLWSERGVGNHWSDYRGYDLSGDGIGDVAHTVAVPISGGMGEEPAMSAFASSPGFRLAAVVEERLGAREPVVTDPIPLMEPHGPALPSPVDGPASQVAGVVPGLAVAAAGLVLLVASRRRRGGLRVA